MLVEDLMRTDLVTCPSDATLRTAAIRMLEHGIGSVIVTKEGSPYGIVTETDALHAGAVTDRPFSTVQVEAIASHPLITTTPETTIRSAIQQMRDNEIKKLPVIDGLELQGIITHTDIVTHYSDFINEAHALEQRRDRWEARKQDVDAVRDRDQFPEEDKD